MKYLIAIMFLLMIGLAQASLGTFKQYECVNIIVPLNTTNVNITNIATPSPNSQIILTNQAMTRNENLFNYSFCSTNKTGIYTYGFCNIEGDCYSNSFEINPIGKISTSILNNPYLLILGLLGLILVLFGAVKGIPWFGFIGSIMFLLLGVYTMIYGFDNGTDLYTRGVAITLLGMGFIFLFTSSYEWLSEDKEEEGDIED